MEFILGLIVGMIVMACCLVIEIPHRIDKRTEKRWRTEVDDANYREQIQ